jgi:hypothetical protein
MFICAPAHSLLSPAQLFNFSLGEITQHLQRRSLYYQLSLDSQCADGVEIFGSQMGNFQRLISADRI